MSTIDIRNIKNLLPEEPVRLRLYTRLEGKSLFGFTDEYSGNALECSHNKLLFAALGIKKALVEFDQEICSHGMSEHVLEALVDAAEGGLVDVLLTHNSCSLSTDNGRCLAIVEKLNSCGVLIYTLDEGWINVPDASGETKLGRLQKRLYTKRESACDTDIEELMDRIIDENLEALEELSK